MSKNTFSYTIQKMVLLSSRIETEFPDASDEILICAEKLSNRDESYMDHYDKTIEIINKKDTILADHLRKNRDMIREAWSPWDFAKNVGEGIGKKVWDKGQKGMGAVQQGIGAVQKGVGKAVDKGVQQVKNVGTEIQQGVQNVQNVQKGIQEMGYKGVSQKLSQEVNTVLDQFANNRDVNILSNQINKILGSYNQIANKIPQTSQAEFTQYLQVLQGLPDKLNDSNAQAFKIMTDFIAASKSSLEQIAAQMLAKEQMAATQKNIPAPQNMQQQNLPGMSPGGEQLELPLATNTPAPAAVTKSSKIHKIKVG